MFQIQEPMEEAKQGKIPIRPPPMLAEPRPERADGAVEKAVGLYRNISKPCSEDLARTLLCALRMSRLNCRWRFLRNHESGMSAARHAGTGIVCFSGTQHAERVHDESRGSVQLGLDPGLQEMAGSSLGEVPPAGG